MKTETALEVIENALREHCEIACYGDHQQQQQIQTAFLQIKWFVERPRRKRRSIVHVRGGVAYCDSPAVRIIDHDNR